MSAAIPNKVSVNVLWYLPIVVFLLGFILGLRSRLDTTTYIHVSDPAYSKWTSIKDGVTRRLEFAGWNL